MLQTGASAVKTILGGLAMTLSLNSTGGAVPVSFRYVPREGARRGRTNPHQAALCSIFCRLQFFFRMSHPKKKPERALPAVS